MKKKVLKTMAITLGLSVIFGTGVYAGSSIEEISAYLNKGVTLTWNGSAFYPYDEDGTRIYPLTYKGRTYIPARFIAEKAGIEVGWDDVNNTVSFTTSDDNLSNPNKDNQIQGTYTKGGNGNVVFLTDDFQKLTTLGYNVEETRAQSDSGTHIVKISKATGTTEYRRTIHMQYVRNMKDVITSNGWTMVSDEILSDGHLKFTCVNDVLPLECVMYSSDNEIVLSASRTDM